ncbi:hypothetical protein SNEBB_010691 [Seison nebaliae]|nr:hypothetical protein SNEBB_010691 [Seison nebaliae]
MSDDSSSSDQEEERRIKRSKLRHSTDSDDSIDNNRSRHHKSVKKSHHRSRMEYRRHESRNQKSHHHRHRSRYSPDRYRHSDKYSSYHRSRRENYDDDKRKKRKSKRQTSSSRSSSSSSSKSSDSSKKNHSPSSNQKSDDGSSDDGEVAERLARKQLERKFKDEQNRRGKMRVELSNSKWSSSDLTRDRHRSKSDKYKENKERSDDLSDNNKNEKMEKDSQNQMEQRDECTIFVMQLTGRMRKENIHEYFESFGEIRDIRIICSRSKKSNTVAYVEFMEPEHVAKCLEVKDHKIRNNQLRIRAAYVPGLSNVGRPSNAYDAYPPLTAHRVYVGNLDARVTTDALIKIFLNAGRVITATISTNSGGGSQGFGFVTFKTIAESKRAVVELDGMKIFDRPMKIDACSDNKTYLPNGTIIMKDDGGDVPERDDTTQPTLPFGNTGRLKLMAKLAESSGVKVPINTARALEAAVKLGSCPIGSSGMRENNILQTPDIVRSTNIIIAPTAATSPTQFLCFANMFNPNKEDPNSNWISDIKDDIIGACKPNGGCLHVHVDSENPNGIIFCKCSSTETAIKVMNSTNRRLFGGNRAHITYVNLVDYIRLFSQSKECVTLLNESTYGC